VGDFARNIETGWLGKIVEILPPQKVWINRHEYFIEVMANMLGVDTLAVAASGLSWEEALSDNDTQQHSLTDLMLAR
jgi:hypothetical protein